MELQPHTDEFDDDYFDRDLPYDVDESLTDLVEAVAAAKRRSGDRRSLNQLRGAVFVTVVAGLAKADLLEVRADGRFPAVPMCAEHQHVVGAAAGAPGRSALKPPKPAVRRSGRRSGGKSGRQRRSR